MKTIDLRSLPIRVSPSMTGAKRAVKLGGLLHVSEAMLGLLSTADESELQFLVESIQVLDLDPKVDEDEVLRKMKEWGHWAEKMGIHP